MSETKAGRNITKLSPLKLLENLIDDYETKVNWLAEQFNLLNENVEEMDQFDNKFLKEQIKLIKENDMKGITDIVIYLNIWYSKLCILLDQEVLLDNGWIDNDYKRSLLSISFLKENSSNCQNHLGDNEERFNFSSHMVDIRHKELRQQIVDAKKLSYEASSAVYL